MDISDLRWHLPEGFSRCRPTAYSRSIIIELPELFYIQPAPVDPADCTKAKKQAQVCLLDKESKMSTLWRREEFLRICSKKELAEKAQNIEVTIPVKKNQETRYNLDPGSFFVHRFWGRRPDGVAINEALNIVYILEFNWSTDRDEGFLEVKDAEANEEHKSIIGALKAAALEWEFEQINFVVGYHGSVVESDFYTKLKKLDIQEGKKDKLFADHATQICEAHHLVIVSFLQQVQGGTRPTTKGSRENIGHNVHVIGDRGRNTCS